MNKQTEKNAARITRELTRLLIALKPDIGDEYRESADDLPGIDITIGVNADASDWSYQTGDNSYSGGAYGYPYWGIGRLYRRSHSRKLAQEIVDNALEQIET